MRFFLLAVLLSVVGCASATAPSPPVSDRDGDGVSDMRDACPSDANRTEDGCPDSSATSLAGLGAACDETADCASGLRCVDDCASGALRGVSEFFAQGRACPRICVAREKVARDPDGDRDGDGVSDIRDACPSDANRTEDGCPDSSATSLAGVGAACDTTADCAPGLRCVDDCASGALGGVSEFFAQVRACPGVCAKKKVAQRVVAAPRTDSARTDRGLQLMRSMAGILAEVVSAAASAGSCAELVQAFNTWAIRHADRGTVTETGFRDGKLTEVSLKVTDTYLLGKEAIALALASVERDGRHAALEATHAAAIARYEGLPILERCESDPALKTLHPKFGHVFGNIPATFAEWYRTAAAERGLVLIPQMVVELRALTTALEGAGGCHEPYTVLKAWLSAGGRRLDRLSTEGEALDFNPLDEEATPAAVVADAKPHVDAYLALVARLTNANPQLLSCDSSRYSAIDDAFRDLNITFDFTDWD